MITRLKNIFGLKCCAISVNVETKEFTNIPSKKMKFCEAVNYSFNVPVRITNANLYCPGARRSIGFENDDSQLAKTVSENNQIDLMFVANALNNIPKVHNIKNINLGMTEYMEKETRPDLFILYLKPDKITSIMHSLAKRRIKPSIPAYSLLSVCGNVFANTYKNHVVSISFGCPESRKYGGIDNNEIVLGFKYDIAELIIKIYEYGL